MPDPVDDERDPSTAGAPSEPLPSTSPQASHADEIETDLRESDFRVVRELTPHGSAQSPQVIRMPESDRHGLVKLDRGVEQGDVLIKNEVAFYEMAKGVHSELVPPTVLRRTSARDGSVVEMSVQEFRLGVDDHPPLDDLPDEVISEAAALDIAGGQQDRERHNWLIERRVGEPPRLWLIDNACSFNYETSDPDLRALNPHGEPRSAMVAEARSRGISPSVDVMEALLAPGDAAWAGAIPYLSTVQVDQARQRLRGACSMSA